MLLSYLPRQCWVIASNTFVYYLAQHPPRWLTKFFGIITLLQPSKKDIFETSIWFFIVHFRSNLQFCRFNPQGCSKVLPSCCYIQHCLQYICRGHPHLGQGVWFVLGTTLHDVLNIPRGSPDTLEKSSPVLDTVLPPTPCHPVSSTICSDS